MFKIICGIFRNNEPLPFTVEIEGCPSCGVDAIDFRRKNRLPLAPTNKIELPGRVFEDETVAREFPKLDNDANVNLEYISVFESKVVNLKVQSVDLRSVNAPYPPLVASPDAIRDYLEHDCITCAAKLLMNIIEYADRSRVKAEAEVYRLCQQELDRRADKVRAVEEAKLLLRDELLGKDNKIQELNDDIDKLNAELDKVTSYIADKDAETAKWKKLYNEEHKDATKVQDQINALQEESNSWQEKYNVVYKELERFKKESFGTISDLRKRIKPTKITIKPKKPKPVRRK